MTWSFRGLGDVITDDGRELAAYLRAQNRDNVLMTGVHTNMCALEVAPTTRSGRWSADESKPLPFWMN